MKLGIFTDSHYSSAEVTCGKRYNSKSLDKIKKAYHYFEDEKVDLVVCLGDLTDTEVSHEKEEANLRQIAEVMQNSPLETVCVMGNHDAFTFAPEDFYKILGIAAPKTIEADGKKLIFLDACYFKNGAHYMPGDSDWKDTFYPHLEQLRQELETTGQDIYIFIHQNLDTNIHESHLLYNAEQINEILAGSGKVKAVYQGHYHPGARCVMDNIEYVAFPAMCENEDACFIMEL